MTPNKNQNPAEQCSGTRSVRPLLLLSIFLTAFILLWGLPASAQLSGKGEIKGVITDPTGAVVPDASVVATSTTRGVKITSKSTSSGAFDLSPLDPDTYTVTVTAPGFQTTTQEHVTVNALEVANVNVALSVGIESQSVTVSAAPPALETSNATLGATMEQEMYAALPIQMGNAGSPDQRRATDFAMLMPGVQGNETNGNTTTNTGVVNGSGSRGAASAVYVNGIPFTSVAGEGDTRFVWTAISVDAVNQFQVQTSGYSALYEGQGVQNYAIKSGTNLFHNGSQQPQFAASKMGITGLPAGQASDAFPIVTFSGVDAPTQWAGTTASRSIANSYALIDNLQWVFGQHSLTLGGQIAWFQYQNTTATTGTSQMTAAFAPSETEGYSSGTTGISTTGIAFASYLIGAPNSETLTQNSVVETGARFRPVSPYVQDDWKVSSRLTLNLGLRWDFYPTYREVYDRLSFFNPALDNPVALGAKGALQFAGNSPSGCNCRTGVKDYYKNFGPRLGFAFQSDPKTVWRGSWGVMYTHGNGVGGSANSRTGTGTLGYTASPKPAATLGVAFNTLDSGFPAYAPAPGPAAGNGYGAGYYTVNGKSFGSPQSVSYGDPYYGGRAPQYINWSFGLQRALTDSLTLTMSYVGS
jgi:hypothetical protein